MKMRTVIGQALLASAAAMAMSGGATAGPDMTGTEKCYGVVKAGKNDCASKAGAHSCAGQAKKDANPAEFVAVPKGLCDKLAGGSTTEQGS